MSPDIEGRADQPGDSTIVSRSTLDETVEVAPDRTGSWLGNLTRWSLAAIAGLGIVSLIAAMLGIFVPVVVLPCAAIATFSIARLLPRATIGPVPWAVAVCLLSLMGAIAALGVSSPHEHIFATRDSGTYVATATWIASTSGLSMDVGDAVFTDLPVGYATVGFPSTGDNAALQPQFLHLFPSLLAIVVSVGGPLTAIYWLNPLIAAIGILAVFTLTREVTSKSWMGLLAAVLIALTMPFIYYSRAPFSETLTLTLVFGGLWALSHALRDASLSFATGAGILFGVVMMTRIDGIVILLGLVLFRTIHLLGSPAGEEGRGQETTSRVMERVISVTTIMLALAMLDLTAFSLQYLVDHGKLIGLVVAAILLLTVIGRQATRWSPAYNRHRDRFADVLATGTGLYLLYAWILRPLVEAPTRSDIYGIQGLQQAAGVAVEPLRSYGELSVRWLTWYLGIPLVLAGLVGLVVLTRRLIARGGQLTGPLTAVAVTSTVLYIFRPSINPDHIWAMRRFLPVVLPAVIVIALLATVGSGLGSRRWVPAVTAAAVLLFAIPLLVTTARAGLSPEFEDAGQHLSRACERLGSNAIVLFVGEGSETRGNALAPTLRGACGITVAMETPDRPLSSGEIEATADRAIASGRALWLIGDTPQGSEQVELFDATYEFLELTLFEPPSEMQDLEVRLTAWRAP